MHYLICSIMHYLICSIMRYLRQNGRLKVDFFKDASFADFRLLQEIEFQHYQVLFYFWPTHPKL